ncbi:tryptophan synthase subunit alpha [Bacillus sp. H-16]|uniref:tryptophan synthase subunit alpha n=1 Tax=Alteribacter salitolerans TaxID=2912333 RepID=UPI001962DA8E|nr:tryptophan synthase subunit alpha [Alteribacter salitolerans]MBM7094644.1 tryptophan synthase subunit alpha [Alteribacter salitolerans]
MTQLTDLKFKEKKNLFIPYIMSGDPSPEATVDVALTLQEAGADVIEWGVPYSDPLADGPVIEQAANRALEKGMNIIRAIELVKEARNRGLTVPVVLFTYVNPVLRVGEKDLVNKLGEAGIDGLLIPDLPMEESGSLRSLTKEKGIALISLIAPTSKKRVVAIARQSEGFLYLVSSLGVTGTRDSFESDLTGLVENVKKVTDTPVAVGFGISKREHVKKFHTIADGAVVGSAIVRFLNERKDQLTGPEKEKALRELKGFVEELIS